MKTKLLFIALLITGSLWAQFTKSTISATDTNGANGLLEKDLNGDTLIDLIGASQSSNTVSYYLNNGDHTFTQTVIDNALTGAAYVDAYDLDGDGDLDFTAVGSSDLVWYENDGNFVFTKHAITTLTNPTFVRAYDADNDGDGDIGVAVYGENTISAFLNDGSGSFSRINAVSISTPKIFNGGDFDGSSSGNILVSSFDGNEIAWYAFNGLYFTRGGTIASNFQGAFGIEGGDIDNDGDDDVVGAAYNDNEIAWFENTSGDGTAFTKHSIDANFIGASYVHWLDIDGDGDKDIAASAYGNGTSGSEVAIYYNDGNQNFTKTVVDNTENGIACFSVQDFDDNGTMDIAYASNLGNKFVLMSKDASAINQSNEKLFSLYPNPAHQNLHISADKNIEKIEIFDITGRRILQTNTRNIDVSQLPKTHYLIQVSFEDGSHFIKKLIVN